MKPLIVALAAVLAAALVVALGQSAARGQIPCLERAAMVEALRTAAGEEHRATVPVEGNDQLVAELYAAEGGRRSWTMVMTTAKGVFCIVAAGTGWRPPSRGEPQ